MNNLTVRWGATLNLTVENDEDGADTAVLTVSLNDDVVITKTANFVDGVADLSLSAAQTQVQPDTYDYMIKVTYDDGTVEKYPETEGCEDCQLPTLEVCDTNDNLEVS